MLLGRLVACARDLRAAGVEVGVDRTATFIRAVQLLDSLDPVLVRRAARATLVSDPSHFSRLDEVLETHLGKAGPPRAKPQPAPRAPRHDPKAFRSALVTFMAERSRKDDPELELSDQAKAATSAEALRLRDFSELTENERQALLRSLRRIEWKALLRRSRRRTSAARGDELDLRAAFRKAARTGGKVLSLPRRRRKMKRRPLILLADISGSMELYTRLLLSLFHGIQNIHPHTETFVFGTRLTHITAALRRRSVDAALDEVTHEVPDFSGGTRIGESLSVFNQRYARRVLQRGSVVLVVSDGWETGDVELLGRELARLKRGCYRLVWLNPLLGRDGYAPEAAGMAMALRHVDDFMPIRNLDSLEALARHLSALPSRKRGGGGAIREEASRRAAGGNT
ncbi:MAG: VWA domain-containing protein [Myxococcota bacterium]